MNVTVQDVLHRIQHCHQQLAKLYSELATAASDERVRMFAEYLAGRERRLLEALNQYQRDRASDTTLGYWFKVDPLSTDDLRLDGVTLSPEITTDELFNFGVRVDERLAALAQRVAEATTSPDVGDLFADLMAQERAEERLTAREALSVEQDS